jgi:anthranilate/para-aminobenzoate synthase component II
MATILVDNESKYTSALQKALHTERPIVINYNDLDYKKLSKGDIVILTGGLKDPILWHKKQYYKETQLVKRHKGPIIGICLGFELIAHIYGSHLHLLNTRRKGEIGLSSTKFGKLSVPDSVLVYESHNWSVPKLKRPLKAVAYSDDGIEIFKHSRKPIYGMQFHPEESSSGGMIIFNEILESLKP